MLLSCTAFAQLTVVDSFLHGGIYRSYRLYVPAGYNANNGHSLIINMHGLGSNSVEQQLYTNFMPIADTAQFLMVYPQGTSSNGTPFWGCGLAGLPPVDDVGFISALIDTVATKYNVNKDLVFATGMSMGGYMSHYLALQLNNRIAAIASVAGTMAPNVYATAAPGRAIPVMDIHGTADGTVPYTGSSDGIHIDTLVSFWNRNNRTNPTPVITAVPNTNTSDGCTADHYVWSGGTKGSTVEFYKIIGGGHTWPGAPISVGVTNQDFSASKEIWRFFRQYGLHQFTAVQNVHGIAGIKVWPNPCKDMLEINTTEHITIRDLSGRILIQANGPQVSMTALPQGIYLLQLEGKIGSITITKQ